MKRWRAHLPGADPESPTWVLGRDESHHLARVLRLRAGDRIAVFDGAGREWEADIVEASPEGAVVRPGRERIDPVDPELEVVLFQGRCRPDRFDWVVQKGTEVGVATFVAVDTARSERARARPERSRRWERIALEAAKQSGRRRVPTVETLPGLPPTVGQDIALLLDVGDGVPISEVLARPAPRSAAVFVGPESGLEPAEAEALVARGWLRVGLGPRTLRTETAGVVASALLLHAWSDLGRVPRD